MTRDRIWYLASKKIASEASAEELSELEELLRNDPDMHYSLQNINDIWELPVRPSADTDEAFNRHIDRMKLSGVNWGDDQQQEYLPFPAPSYTSRRWKWVSVVAASLTVGIFIYYQGRQPDKPTVAAQSNAQTAEKNEIYTYYGSTSEVKLPDGSRVLLNAGSHFNYSKNFGNQVREVELTGEAYFDVVKNARVPFIIHTSSMDIKVLGTQFNVKSYPGEKTAEASLIRGSIEVFIKKSPEKKFILKPNEKIVVANETELHARAVNKTAKTISNPIVRNLTYAKLDSTIIETSWVDNKLIFEDESFKEVAIKLERRYGVSIHFTDETVEQFRFTGTFQNESIGEALHALKIAGPVNYRLRDNIITISK